MQALALACRRTSPPSNGCVVAMNLNGLSLAGELHLDALAGETPRSPRAPELTDEQDEGTMGRNFH
jgi:hypothetical protein